MSNGIKFKNKSEAQKLFTAKQFQLVEAVTTFCEMDDPEGFLEGSWYPWAFWVTGECALTGRSLSGVCGSLAKDGWVMFWEEEDETTFEATQKFLDLFELDEPKKEEVKMEIELTEKQTIVLHKAQKQAEEVNCNTTEIKCKFSTLEALEKKGCLKILEKGKGIHKFQLLGNFQILEEIEVSEEMKQHATEIVKYSEELRVSGDDDMPEEVITAIATVQNDCISHVAFWEASQVLKQYRQEMKVEAEKMSTMNHVRAMTATVESELEKPAKKKVVRKKKTATAKTEKTDVKFEKLIIKFERKQKSIGAYMARFKFQPRVHTVDYKVLAGSMDVIVAELQTYASEWTEYCKANNVTETPVTLDFFTAYEKVENDG